VLSFRYQVVIKNIAEMLGNVGGVFYNRSRYKKMEVIQMNKLDWQIGDVVSYTKTDGDTALAYIKTGLLTNGELIGVSLDVEWLPIPAKIVYGSRWELVGFYPSQILKLIGKDNPQRVF